MSGKKIFLVGMMGVGKTTMGKKLSRLANFDFIDTDQRITEQQGKSVNEIFARDGEIQFRRLESNLLDHILLKKSDCIISTGGGFACNKNAMNKMKANGMVLYMAAKPAFIASRITQSRVQRPLLAGFKNEEEIIEAVKNLLKTRRHYYEQAHLKITVPDLGSEDVWNQILLTQG